MDPDTQKLQASISDQSNENGSDSLNKALLGMADESREENLDCVDAPLGRKAVLSYGIGHMLNDLCAACWFTYILVFLTDIGLTPRQASIVMISGQFADGIATIIVGELIDRFGHFKLWHIGGSILVAVSFSSVFGACWVCIVFGTNSATLRTVTYSIFAAIFNIGWAATQVSHMAIVNCLTSNPTSRVCLTSCRNAFTMVANLSLFAIAYIVFKLISGATPEDIETQYRWIAFSAIAFGICFVIKYCLAIKEPRLTHHSLPRSCRSISWSFWLKRLLYYQAATVYMIVRLITNVSQALLAFYLIDDLLMSESSKAVVPAVIYICSFLASIVLQELQWSGFRLKSFFNLGAVMWLVSSCIIYVLPSHLQGSVYLLSILIGVANALMLVTAVGMQSVLVGKNLNGSAFVYGSLSFLDKFSCGIVLYIVEGFHSTGCERRDLGGCPSLTRVSLAFVTGGCALLGILVTLPMKLEETSMSVLSEPLLV